MNMGQTESLKKIRGLRKDIARVKTILREQQLAGARKTEKKYHGRNNTEARRTQRPQGCGRRSCLEPDAEDHRGRGRFERSRIRSMDASISQNKKFYAHDEKNEAHVGDVVRLEETRPLSKLKRWKLERSRSQNGPGAGSCCRRRGQLVGARNIREKRLWQ